MIATTESTTREKVAPTMYSAQVGNSARKSIFDNDRISEEISRRITVPEKEVMFNVAKPANVDADCVNEKARLSKKEKIYVGVYVLVAVVLAVITAVVGVAIGNTAEYANKLENKVKTASMKVAVQEAEIERSTSKEEIEKIASNNGYEIVFGTEIELMEKVEEEENFFDKICDSLSK